MCVRIPRVTSGWVSHLTLDCQKRRRVAHAPICLCANRVRVLLRPQGGVFLVPLTLHCPALCHLQEDYVLYYYANLSVPVGRFQSRAHLVGDVAHSDGSLLLRDVGEADQGTYTCEIRLERESLVVKKAVVLHVLPAEPRGACRCRPAGRGFDVRGPRGPPPPGPEPTRSESPSLRRDKDGVTLLFL